MHKIMPVDVLSSIKGAKPSESVNKLFETIKTSNIEGGESTMINQVLSVDDLRDDEVILCDNVVKDIIKENFPRQKDQYLIVPKIIEV